MLVLSRKRNESLVIANEIVVTVIEIRGDKVRLGIEAPKEVPIHRGEVYEMIRGYRRAWYAPDQASCAEEVEFLKAIDDNPHDTSLLLVYADWLEERGDDRSDLIRRRCAIYR